MEGINILILVGPLILIHVYISFPTPSDPTGYFILEVVVMVWCEVSISRVLYIGGSGDGVV